MTEMGKERTFSQVIERYLPVLFLIALAFLMYNLMQRQDAIIEQVNTLTDLVNSCGCNGVGIMIE